MLFMRYQGRYTPSRPRKYKGDPNRIVYRSLWERKIANKKYLVEVKPFRQTKEPKTQKKITKTYIREVVTWSVNSAKWKAATKFCKDHNWKFMIITEKELKI